VQRQFEDLHPGAHPAMRKLTMAMLMLYSGSNESRYQYTLIADERGSDNYPEGCITKFIYWIGL
jgi:hypothetical protein